MRDGPGRRTTANVHAVVRRTTFTFFCLSKQTASMGSVTSTILGLGLGLGLGERERQRSGAEVREVRCSPIFATNIVVI